jgi:hypothetical protein
VKVWVVVVVAAGVDVAVAYGGGFEGSWSCCSS